MLKVLIFFVRFFLLWMTFFFAERLIFLFSYWQELDHDNLGELIGVFYHGLRLDLAMTAYLVVAPLLYFLFHLFKGTTTINFSWLQLYNKILLIIFSIISVINLNIYREWGSKINAKAIEYAVSSPNEALASAASSPIFVNLFILAILIALIFLANKVFNFTKLLSPTAYIWPKIAILLPSLILTFLLIRGGIGVSPNNQSMAYFSDQQLLNHAAVNTEWNLMASLLKSGQIAQNPYVYYDQKSAAQTVNALFEPVQGQAPSVLTTKKPNIVLVIMESFTADLTNVLGGEQGITPQFDTLVNKGILFSNIYSTGNRTDKGIIGTLAGQPSLSAENLVKWPDKLEKLPAISQVLSAKGYQTSFYYGGESEFDNYKVFIMSHRYDRLVDKRRFDAKDMNSKWGAYDGTVFNRQLADLNKGKQPFFSTVMTLTNHEPFEVPGHYKFGKNNNTERFKSTAFYTDSCIGDYLNKAKKQPWYKNTLFIFVADHGHIMPKGREAVYIPQRYHVPLLFYGEVIKKEYRGSKIDHIGSQIDVPVTLLNQMDLNSSPFKWSKDLLNPASAAFAFFSWDNGIGFIDKKQCVTFDNVGKMVLYNDHPADARNTDKLLQQSKSFIQAAYQQFLQL